MLRSGASTQSLASNFDDSLRGLPYSETRASNSPIRVTSTTSLHRIADFETDKPQYSPTTGDTASTSSNKKYQPDASLHDGDWPRTALAGSISARESQNSLNTKSPTISSLTSATVSIPHVRVHETATKDSIPDRRSNFSSVSSGSNGRWLSLTSSRPDSTAYGEEVVKDAQNTSAGFKGIALDIQIPTGGFADDLSTGSVEFSKRGSMLIDGKRVNQPARKPASHLTPIMDDDKGVEPVQEVKSSVNGGGDSGKMNNSVAASTAEARDLHACAPAKALSTDEEALSEKVRAFYAAGTDEPLETESTTNIATRMGARWEATVQADTRSSSGALSLSRATSKTDLNDEVNGSRQTSMAASASQTYLILEREENELAGGLEDWKDINSADVDRYGFIIARAPTTSVDGAEESKPRTLTRVSTSLQLASETPRRKNTLRRTPSSTYGSMRSTHSKQSAADQTPPRPSSSQSAYARTPRRSTSSRIPVPGSKNRRLMDSAMDMLTLPNSAQSVVENGHIHIDNARARRKEVEREEKWRRMARVTPPAKDPKTGKPVVGAGSESEYTFDTTSPKLIERTWKGIPDKWRATAWHSFLSKSAARRKNCLSDSQLIHLFHNYQDQSSPDDVQIDIDVPRTISSHIMFRRRYRGGQRLLFRVLHAMSLHFAATGYVQGMAALAVTLLAYYDEEKAFVMLVRMWELRGLDELYKSGFGGLMTALGDFEQRWLGQGEVARKLVCSSFPVYLRPQRLPLWIGSFYERED